MKIFTFNSRFVSLWAILLVACLLVISVAGCQPAPQGYKGDPEAVQFNETGMKYYNAGII